MMLKARSRAKWFAVALVAAAVPAGLAYAQTPVLTATFTAPPPKPIVSLAPTTLWSLPLDVNSSAPYSPSGAAPQVQAFLRLNNVNVFEMQHVSFETSSSALVFTNVLVPQPPGKYAITINAHVGASPTTVTVSKTIANLNSTPAATVGTCTLTAGKADYSESRACTVTGLPVDARGEPQVVIKTSGMVYLDNLVLSYRP